MIRRATHTAVVATKHLETWLSAKAPPRSVGRPSRNSKFDVIRGGVVEGVVPPPSNADHASLGHSLFALLFTGMVFDVGLD